MLSFMPYVWNNGGGVLSDDGKTSRLNESGSVEEIQMLYDLTHKYKVTPASVTSYSWGEAQDAFLTGKASQIVIGSGAIYSFVSGQHKDINWGSALIPKGPHGSGYSSFSGGDSIAIISQSTHTEESWDFIQHALTKDVQVNFMAKEGMLPARSDLFDNQYFNSNAAYSTLRDAMIVAVGPYSLKYKEMYAPILEGLQNALNGVKTPQQAMDEASNKVIFRTIFFAPVVISMTCCSLVWLWIYNYLYGVLNYILTSLRIVEEPILFMNSTKTSMAAIVFMVTWKMAGFSMLIILSALQAIDVQVYETASVEGAGKVRVFCQITLPLIRSYVTLAMIIP